MKNGMVRLNLYVEDVSNIQCGRNVIEIDEDLFVILDKNFSATISKSTNIMLINFSLAQDETEASILIAIQEWCDDILHFRYDIELLVSS